MGQGRQRDTWESEISKQIEVTHLDLFFNFFYIAFRILHSHLDWNFTLNSLRLGGLIWVLGIVIVVDL